MNMVCCFASCFRPAHLEQREPCQVDPLVEQASQRHAREHDRVSPLEVIKTRLGCSTYHVHDTAQVSLDGNGTPTHIANLFTSHLTNLSTTHFANYSATNLTNTSTYYYDNDDTRTARLRGVVGDSVIGTTHDPMPDIIQDTLLDVNDTRSSLDSLKQSISLNGTDDTPSTVTAEPSHVTRIPTHELVQSVKCLTYMSTGNYGSMYKGMWHGAVVSVKFMVSDTADESLVNEPKYDINPSRAPSHPNLVQTFALRVSKVPEDASPPPGQHMDPNNLPKVAEAFASGDGFGSPYSNTAPKPIDVGDVAWALGARPGQYITILVLEHCDRGTLQSAIDRGLFKACGKWSWKLAFRALLRTATEVARGMAHLHAWGVVHGDLCPSNVLLAGSRMDRRGFVAKVHEYWLSKFFTEDREATTPKLGTPGYTAPERTNNTLTPASDIYSFGVLLWSMYTGLHPSSVMHAEGPHMPFEWPEEADPRLVRICKRCMHEVPAMRPSFELLITKLAKLESVIRKEAAPNTGRV